MNTPTPRTCPRCKNDFSRCDEMFDCANRRDIPTPITDGASFGAYIADGSGHVVKSVVEVKVAKKLERDLAARDAELARAYSQLAAFDSHHCESEGCAIGSDVVFAQAQKYRQSFHDIKQRAERAEAALAEREKSWNLAMDRQDETRSAWMNACKKAEAERDAAMKDAERYRWLRAEGLKEDGDVEVSFLDMNEDGSSECYYEKRGNEMDAAIDQAREGK